MNTNRKVEYEATMNYAAYIDEYREDINKGLGSILCTDASGSLIDPNDGLAKWVDLSEEKRKNDGIFFFAGNGASATMAEHMSHDCFQNADFLTETVSETSHLTAIANDISYEDVFSYRISKMLKEKDMLVTISSSGNSPNIIKAIEEAKRKGAFVVTLSGKRSDNKSRQMGDLNFYIPLETYGMVESSHAVFLHCWLDMYLDKYKGGRH